MSRILREYHQTKNAPLPSWLYDDRTPISAIASVPVEAIQRSKTTRTRRLWQQESSEESARERERRELRSEALSRTKSERFNSSSNNSSRLFPEQRTNARYMQHQQEEEAEQHQLNGSIAPRRTNTTRRYLDKTFTNNNHIIRSATVSQRSNNNSYF